MKTIKIAFLVLIPLFGLSQGIETQTNINQVATGGDPTQVVRVFDDRYQGVKGSQFYWDSYISGRIILSDGKVFALKSMNYDVFSDEVVFKSSSDGQVKLLNKKNISSFESDSLSCFSEFCRFKKFDFSKEGLPSGFYAMLVDGKIKVLCKLSKTLLKADFKGAYSSSQNYDRFIDERRFYLIDKDGLPTPFKTTQKSILELRPNYADLIKKFIKDNKYNPKEVSDLIKIFSFINNL